MLKMNSLMITFVVVLSAFGSLLHAEEERPTVEHVLDFLKEKMPKSMDLLERVKEEEGEEGYAEVVESAADLLMEYLEIKREEGAEAAENFLDEERTGVRMESLVEAWHEAADEAGKREIRKEIGKLIGAQIDREIEHGHRELKKLKEEVEEIEEELVEMKESREGIIAEELREILSDEEEWEEEEQEEQDEEGDGEDTIKQSWSQEKNYARPYWVNVPELDDGEALPVIIFLHGNGGNARGLQRMVLNRYPKVASQSITVFPEGYRESWNIVSERSKADDRAFVEAIIRELAERDDVKKNDFTIMGISNGAALVNQIAIETKLPNIKNYISAVSPLNGFQYDGKNFKSRGEENDYEEVGKPLVGKRLLNISGTNDPLVPYRGGPSKAIPAKGGKLPFVDAEESIFMWAKQMGYGGKKLREPSKVNGKIEVFSYLDGDVVHFKVNDHGHNATQALSQDLLLEFLKGE
jgi:poly(3-hydroxybutyrate) depolymerase